MPGDPSALVRLLQMQQAPASPQTTAADIARVLDAAAQRQEALRQEQLGGRLADIGYGTVISAQPEEAAPQPPQYPEVSPAPQLHAGETAPDPLAAPPEALLAPGAEGSAVAAPQETTQLQTYTDPSTGMFVVQAPGNAGHIEIPLSADPNEVLASLSLAQRRWRGSDVFGGDLSTSALSMGRAQDVGNAFAAARLAAGRQQQIQQSQPGPLTTTTTDLVQHVAGPVSPQHAAGAVQAGLNERQAQADADQARLAVEEERARGFDRRGQFLDQQAAQMRQVNDAIDREAGRRIMALDNTIQGLQTNTINPNEFFGPGVAGRLVPALAVAMGAIGSALTGTPNGAMQIIDQAVNRSMQAQLANQANARGAAAQKANALRHFEQIVGDRRGAEAALRQAHYAAFLNQIDSRMTRAGGANLAALQALRQAVVERMQADGLVAQDRARLAAQIHVQTQLRQHQGPTAGEQTRSAIRTTMAQDAAQAAQAATPQATGQQGAQGLFQAGEGGTVETPNGTIRIPSIAMSPGAQAALAQAEQRLQRNPNDRQARDTVASGRRRRRSDYQRTERAIRRQLPPLTWDEADARHFLQDVGRLGRGGVESGATVPELPPRGFRWMRPEDGEAGNPQERYAHMMHTLGESGRGELFNAMRMTALLNESLPMILSSRRNYGGTVTDRVKQTQLARQLATNYRQLLMQARTGANFSPEEREEYLDLMPDPTEITASSVFNLWDHVLSAWENFMSVHGTDARAVLNQFGITTDNTTANAQINTRRGQRLQDRAQARRQRQAVSGGGREDQGANMSVPLSSQPGEHLDLAQMVSR